MILTLFLIFIPLILIDMFIPYTIRKTTVFGISIPEPFIDDEKLAQFKRKYTKLIAFIQIPFITILILIAIPLNDMQQSLVMVAGIFVYLIISIIVYLRLHHLVMHYKQSQGWDQQVSIVRVSSFETKFRKEGRAFPHLLFIPAFLITIGLTVWLVYLYPQLPEVIPTHWGLNGEPDAWSDKSFFSVFFLIFTLLFTQTLVYGLSYGVFHSSVKLNAQQSELSLQREHAMRDLTTLLMAFINIISTLFLGIILVQSNWHILYADSTLSIMYSIPIFLVLTFASIYYYMKRTKQLNEQFKELNDLESGPGDDQHWKWGMFYFNKDDHELFVEKKFGVGWTINFARPSAWFFLFLIIVVPLLPMFFL